MKKYIVTKLVILVLVITAILLSISIYIMLDSAYDSFYDEASVQISQINEILKENDSEVIQVQDELNADFLVRAKAASYMIQHNPSVVYDINQLEEIINLLQIDEIHLFNNDGIIFAGNVPEYYGFSVHDGEQISFFSPLLDSYDLEMIQEVTPNTAEGKPMQYVALWSEDRKHIVQIGIEPIRLLDALATTDLSYIFSLLTPSSNTVFFAVDIKTGIVISSTNEELNGKSLSEFDLYAFDEEQLGTPQNVTISGENGHMMLEQQSDDIYIAYYRNHASIYNSTLIGIAILIIISLAIAAVIIVLIYYMLDRIVLRRLLKLGEGMSMIAYGDLDYKMNVSGLPEFDELSNNVNFMVKKILESSRKFATIFEHVNVPIAMYECNGDSVIATGKLAEILQIDSDRLNQYLKSPDSFISFIDDIMNEPHPLENNLFKLPTDLGERYIKLMRYHDGQSDWGLIIDETDEIIEKYTIKQERDVDYLTGIYNKRAFFEHFDELTIRSEYLKKAAVLMFDLDNLKYVNDTWGHATGDDFICAAGDVLLNCKYDNKLFARLSGDEFVMVLYGADDYAQLEIALEQLKEDFSKAYIITPEGTEHKVSVSIGYSLYPEHSGSLHACISFADKAMYVAKSKRKGTIEKYEFQ